MEKSAKWFLLGIASALIIFLLTNQASAGALLGSGAPTVVSYQGVIQDGGSPYTGTGYFKFALVNAAGDTSYWSNDGSSSGGAEPADGVALDVSEGRFQVLLGDTDLVNMIALPASAFSGTDRYLRIWFSPDDITYTLLAPDQRIAAVPYALQAEEAHYADYASDADYLDGLDSTDFVAVYGDTMVGTLTLAGDPVGDLDAATKGYVDNLEARVAILESELAAIQTLLASVSLENGGDDLIFTDVNVHVRSGSGATDGAVNGRGNLIVGYNENDGDTRTGSHNLVVGPYHSYTSYGGLIAGYNNTTSGNYASVSGGILNIAGGEYSSVSGGYDNTASLSYSSISGGTNNTASGSYSSVSGGSGNTASGRYSSISGGGGNTASGRISSITGGYQNVASGISSSISGGAYNTASDYYSSVSGGYDRSVDDIYDWRAGGYWQDQ